MPQFDESGIKGADADAARPGGPPKPKRHRQPGDRPEASARESPNDACLHDAGNHASRDAWSGATRTKEVASASLLVTLLQRRLCWLAEVKDELERNHAAQLRPHRPFLHPRDSYSRNWDVQGFECAEVSTRHCFDKFRLIVDRLRDQYDMR